MRLPGTLLELIDKHLENRGLAKLAFDPEWDRSWSGTVTWAFFRSPWTFEVSVKDAHLSQTAAPKRGAQEPPKLVLQAAELRVKFAFSDWRWQLTGVDLPQRGTCEVQVLKASQPEKPPPVARGALIPPPQVAPTQPPEKPVSWTGIWRISERQSLSLRQTGNEVLGVVLPENYPIRATIYGRRLNGTCTAGREAMTLSLTMRPDGDSFAGIMRSPSGRRSADWIGQRTSETPADLSPPKGLSDQRRSAAPETPSSGTQ